MRALSDEPLAALAAEQGGPVSRGQARAAGLSRGMIGRRVAQGRWHEVFPGVWAVGHRAMTPKGWLVAAVLAGGPGAVASHRSAAWWHGVLPTSRSRHDVTTRRHRESDRIDFHRCRLTDADVTVVEGVPVTTLARTFLDLAEVVPRRRVERAVDEADATPLREVVELHAPGSTLTRSELEERFLELVDAAGIDRPRVNHHVAGYEVDAWWPGLAVELDGHRFHGTRRRALADRRKQRALEAAGHRVLRFGWEEVVHHPAEVVAALASARWHA